MKKIRNFSGVLWAFICLPAFCATVYGISLNDCINEVLDTNPKVLEKLKTYNSAVHIREAIRTKQNFTIDLDSEAGRQNVSNASTRYKTSINDVSGARIVARKLLNDGNRLHKDIASLESNARSALFTYMDTANVCAYETAEAYINILKYRELVILAEENVEIHTRLMKNIKARVEAKTSGKSELERVSGRLAMAQSTLVARKNDYRKAIYQMHKLMGRFIDGSELEMPSLPGSLIPSSLTLAIQKQWDCNPNLIASEYNINTKKKEYEREHAENRPDLYLEGIRDWRKNRSGLRGEENESSVMLRLSIPIYDGGFSKQRKEYYKSLIHHEKYLRDNVARTILNDLNLSYSGYKLLENQIGAVRKSLLFTKRALRSYQQEFKLGKRLLINILDAEVEYQNLRSQLAALRADLLISKYRLLYSIGAIVEDLGLEIPYAKELAEAKRARPAGKDELPLIKDLDQDGIFDNVDVSVNSLKGEIVNELGEKDDLVKEYLSESTNTKLNDELVLIKTKADLQLKSIKPDVPTEMDFISFEPNSEELSPQAKILMREIIPQLRRLADDGQIKITVTEGKSGSDSELLALRRAYNIKRILTTHLFDSDSIFVEARKPINQEKTNSMVLTVQSDLSSFSGGAAYVIRSDSLVFSGKSEMLTTSSTSILKELVNRFNKNSYNNIDVVAYSNDMKNPNADKALSQKRAEYISSTMKILGLYKKPNPIGWGSYEPEIDLYNIDTKSFGENYVEFIVRD